MSWLTTVLKSSLGKKFVMAITGLLLCGFLVVHLAGNLLLYVSPEAYNNYAHSLHKQEWLILVAEVGLLVLFLAHVFLAVSTTRMNWAARGKGYAMKESKRQDRIIPAENWMFTSGAVVLGFILLHLADFRFGVRLPAPSPTEEPFDKALRILKDPVSAAVYTVGCFILGLHLWHGFSSALQTIGLNHPRYWKLIRCVGIIFAVVIAAGFISFPVVWANLRH